MGAIEDPEAKRKRIARRWKVGIALVIGVVAAPFVIAGIEGLAGLFVIWVMGTVGLQLAPVISMKVANWKIKAIKAEAEKNPIETMENIYKDKSVAIQDGDDKIVAFEGRFRTYMDQLEQFKDAHPTKAARFEQIGKTMLAGLHRMKKKQRIAKAEQKAYWEKVVEAKAIFAMALAAQAVSELSADAEQQVFQQIKEQVAFDTINNTFNSAVAAMSLDLEDPEEFSPDLLTSNKDLPKLAAVPADEEDDLEKLESSSTTEKVIVRK